MGRETLVREEGSGRCRKALGNVGGHRTRREVPGRQVNKSIVMKPMESFTVSI